MEVSKNVIMILNEIAMSKSMHMDWTIVKEEGPPHARKVTWSLKMGEFETTGVGHTVKQYTHYIGVVNSKKFCCFSTDLDLQKLIDQAFFVRPQSSGAAQRP